MWLYGVASALVGLVVVLVRKVLTNEKQIALLQQQLVVQEKYGKERDDKIENTLQELRTDVKILMRGKYE